MVVPNMNPVTQKRDKHHRYRKKYKHVKKIIKSMIIENAALCDEVAKIQESILIVKDERKFLYRKLLEYSNEAEPVVPNRMSNNVHNGTGKVKRRTEANSRNS